MIVDAFACVVLYRDVPLHRAYVQMLTEKTKKKNGEEEKKKKKSLQSTLFTNYMPIDGIEPPTSDSLESFYFSGMKISIPYELYTKSALYP